MVKLATNKPLYSLRLCGIKSATNALISTHYEREDDSSISAF